MNDFDTAMTAAHTAIADTFGEAATYTPVDGSEAVGLTDMTFVEDDPDPATGRDGTSVTRTASAVIAAADIAAPARGDVVTHNGEDWTVQTARSLAGGVRWELALQRSDTVERAGRRFRDIGG